MRLHLQHARFPDACYADMICLLLSFPVGLQDSCTHDGCLQIGRLMRAAYAQQASKLLESKTVGV